MLNEAAADGRLTLGEHADRVERAYAARTLGDLAGLTTDLALPSAQPIRLDSRRVVAGPLAKEHRDGRWVVPASMPVTAIGGDVILDLRDAVLQSQRTTLYVTAVAGQVRIIVPDSLAVTMTGTAVLGRKIAPRAPAAAPGQPVVEIRVFALAGTVRVVAPRRSRWRGLRPRRPG
jgi:hypothetical protein